MDTVAIISGGGGSGGSGGGSYVDDANRDVESDEKHERVEQVEGIGRDEGIEATPKKTKKKTTTKKKKPKGTATPTPKKEQTSE
jgi:hypothetical protein